MKQAFTPVDEVGVEDKPAGVVDDLPEQSGVHESFLFFFQVLVRAHDAAEIADARGLNPEANRKVGKYGLAPSVVGVDLKQTPVVAGRTPAVTFLPRGSVVR